MRKKLFRGYNFKCTIKQIRTETLMKLLEKFLRKVMLLLFLLLLNEL